jgi:biotin carboxyl carrier protein
VRALAAVALLLALLAPAPVAGQPAGFFTRDGVPVRPVPVAKVLPDGRTAYDTGYAPFATVGAVTVLHPAKVVEAIGFHQSNDEGARDQQVLGTAAGPVLLEDRGRLSGRYSAADVVVHPDVEIRAPVTGTVVRAGTYVLYCDHSDDFVVISPDAQPGWEVKVLHIDGVLVAPGDRVQAGVTVLAPRATALPFASQVDDHTAAPHWPHTHVEVVDPSIPNVPNGGSGSSC